VKKNVLIFYACLILLATGLPLPSCTNGSKGIQEENSEKIDHPMTTQEFYPILIPLGVHARDGQLFMNHDAVLEYTLQLIKQNNAI
jgi:hypothetical protein